MQMYHQKQNNNVAVPQVSSPEIEATTVFMRIPKIILTIGINLLFIFLILDFFHFNFSTQNGGMLNWMSSGSLTDKVCSNFFSTILTPLICIAGLLVSAVSIFADIAIIFFVLMSVYVFNKRHTQKIFFTSLILFNIGLLLSPIFFIQVVLVECIVWFFVRRSKQKKLTNK